MNLVTRRRFLLFSLSPLVFSWTKRPEIAITVTGPVRINQLGTTLSHEHVLVDFIGADKISFDSWNRENVLKKVLPYFMEARQAGVHTVLECTPAYLGRDPELLKMISIRSGLLLITNTGYYGAVNNKYLPSWAFTETATQLAERWIKEFDNGIDNTGIKPGFIKISVDAAESGLSEIHRKIVQAAAITHKRTGLMIHSHTGLAPAAFEQIEIIKKEGVLPDAFVWVHAQAEADYTKLVEAAQTGAWVSLDNIVSDFDKYAERLALLKKHHLLHKVLISHDAGYYRPGEPDGGVFKGYTDIFSKLIPILKSNNFTGTDVDQLLIKNPSEAVAIRKRIPFFK